MVSRRSAPPRTILAGLAVALILAAVATPSSARITTWYVSATAPPGGDGSRTTPFGSLVAVEQASSPGDTIVVIPAPRALDGGIALKAGQRLVGGGPPVIGSNASDLPRVTNTSAERHGGDAVALADDTEVTNLVIAGSYRGGVYGLDVTGVSVHGNDVSGHNTSCTVGFQILPIVAPSNAPGVGVPFGIRLPVVGDVYVLDINNGWAGIMLDATHATGTITIDDNLVHDAGCGDGIDIRLKGTADVAALVRRNVITKLAQGHFEAQPGSVGVDSLIALGFQTDEFSRLVVDAVGNSQTYIGSEGSDCEGIFASLSGSSSMTVRIDRNTFAHGIGGDSCNGMEMITGNGDPTADMRISNSLFEDNPGDMLEAGNLGSGSKMRLELDNVIVRNTTIALGNGGPIPFNIGECLLVGSSGSGNVTSLRVRNSEITGCNNGVFVGSNAAIGNGVGPDGSIAVDISGSRIHRNKYYNLWVQTGMPLRNLTVKVENTDLSNAGETGVAFDQKLLVGTIAATIDLGGGPLGSVGNNCIAGSARYDAESTGFAVTIEDNWWGSSEGPAAAKTSAAPVVGNLDFDPWLEKAPACASSVLVKGGAATKSPRAGTRPSASLPATGVNTPWIGVTGALALAVLLNRLRRHRIGTHSV